MREQSQKLMFQIYLTLQDKTTLRMNLALSYLW